MFVIYFFIFRASQCVHEEDFLELGSSYGPEINFTTDDAYKSYIYMKSLKKYNFKVLNKWITCRRSLWCYWRSSKIIFLILCLSEIVNWVKRENFSFIKLTWLHPSWVIKRKAVKTNCGHERPRLVWAISPTLLRATVYQTLITDPHLKSFSFN